MMRISISERRFKSIQLIHTMNIETVRGRKHEFFVDELPPGLDCVLCKNVLVDPVMIPCHGVESKMACQECVKYARSKGQAICGCGEKHMGDFPKVPFVVQTLLLGMISRCNHFSQGCNWTGPWAQLAHHEKNFCSFLSMKCPHVACDQIMERRFIETHAEKCQHCPIHCDFCQVSTTPALLPEHHSKCADFPLKCVDCSDTFPRKELEPHGDVCPEKLIPCIMAEIGCREVLKRKSQHDHNYKNVVYHNELTTLNAMTMNRELERMKHDLRHSNAENEEFRHTINEMKENFQHIMQNMAVTYQQASFPVFPQLNITAINRTIVPVHNRITCSTSSVTTPAPIPNTPVTSPMLDPQNAAKTSTPTIRILRPRTGKQTSKLSTIKLPCSLCSAKRVETVKCVGVSNRTCYVRACNKCHKSSEEDFMCRDCQVLSIPDINSEIKSPPSDDSDTSNNLFRGSVRIAEPQAKRFKQEPLP